jgi:transposase
MDIHKNARLTLRSREALVEIVGRGGVGFSRAAASFRVTPKTAAKWVRRYQSEGAAGLRDRSSRPHRSPRATSSGQAGLVIELRRQHRPAYQIAHSTGLSPATVSRILRRAHLSRWRDLHPLPPVVRYEHPFPGDLLHLDIKGMTRFQQVCLARRRPPPWSTETSWLGSLARRCRRSLALGLHSDPPRSESPHHHCLPQRCP